MFVKPELRGIDALGSGAFGASRSGRRHRGIDLRAKPGQEIFSHVDGVVTKLGIVYAPSDKTKKARLKSKLRYVQVTDSAGFKHRFFYVRPLVALGDPIASGTLLGTCQDLKAIWLMMRNHVHYEVKTRGGSYLDPNNYL